MKQTTLVMQYNSPKVFNDTLINRRGSRRRGARQVIRVGFAYWATKIWSHFQTSQEDRIRTGLIILAMQEALRFLYETPLSCWDAGPESPDRSLNQSMG